MKSLIVPAVAAALFAAPAAGQEAPKPGPQHQRLAYFAGSWQFSGETKDSPMGPGGKTSGADMCQWFAGGFHLVCTGDANGPRGAVTTGAIWSWDPAQNMYTYYGYASNGDGFFITGSVEGRVWTWNADFPSPAGPVKLRATITEEPPSAYAFKLEMSADGTTWMPIEEGRATKKSK